MIMQTTSNVMIINEKMTTPPITVATTIAKEGECSNSATLEITEEKNKENGCREGKRAKGSKYLLLNSLTSTTALLPELLPVKTTLKTTSPERWKWSSSILCNRSPSITKGSMLIRRTRSSVIFKDTKLTSFKAFSLMRATSKVSSSMVDIAGSFNFLSWGSACRTQRFLSGYPLTSRNHLSETSLFFRGMCMLAAAEEEEEEEDDKKAREQHSARTIDKEREK